MRKKVFGKKLGRNRRSRKILFRSLAKSLIMHGKITTTKAKAQALLPEAERLMGLVKKEGLAARRAALAALGNDKKVADRLFGYKELADSRDSGFVTMTPLAVRRGDAAEMVAIEWTKKGAASAEAAASQSENISNKAKRS